MSARLTLTQKEEFSYLVKLNMKRAYFTALGILGSHDDAMEASQEAFIRAYRHFHKFDKSKKFFTWYYKILRNYCLNMIRNKGRKKETELFETDSAETDTIRQLEQTEMKMKIQQALFELDIEDREIIILKEFENQSYKEISELLDIPIGTVMSRLFYARKKLAKKIEGEL